MADWTHWRPGRKAWERLIFSLPCCCFVFFGASLTNVFLCVSKKDEPVNASAQIKTKIDIQFCKYFLAFLQKEGSRTRVCNLARQILFHHQPIPNQDNKILRGFSVQCTTNIILEVQDGNETLCNCSRKVDEGIPSCIRCKKKFHSNFSVVISVKNVNSEWGERCTFSFNFDEVAGAPPVTMYLALKISPGKKVTPRFVVNEISTHFFLLTLQMKFSLPVLILISCLLHHHAWLKILRCSWKGQSGWFARWWDDGGIIACLRYKTQIKKD